MEDRQYNSVKYRQNIEVFSGRLISEFFFLIDDVIYLYHISLQLQFVADVLDKVILRLHFGMKNHLQTCWHNIMYAHTHCKYFLFAFLPF